MVCQETVARVERHEQRGFKPVKWLLTQCGVIPINRVKDNPRAMRTIADSWLHERRALDLGIPHSGPHLQTPSLKIPTSLDSCPWR